MDQLTANIRLRAERNKILHVRRVLPSANGHFNVAVGQEVAPEDILGSADAPAGFRTIHLAKVLKVSPSQAPSYLKREIGQPIYEGELLAAKEGFMGLKKNLLLSPIDGLVDYYDNQSGDLRIKLLPKVTKLVSGVTGIVDAIDKEGGIITIRTMASVIYGVFGSGKERSGMLKVLGSSGDLIGSKQISEEMSGQIVVGGGLVFLEALQKAVGFGVSGVISGGINARDYKALAGGSWNLSKDHWSDVGFSIVVTEGFDGIAIGEDIFSLLKEYNGKFVIIDGNKSKIILPTADQNAMIYIRKTSLPLNAQTTIVPRTEQVGLRAGSKVRIVCAPFMGYQGVVEAIDKTVTKLPSGISTYMVTVDTPSKKLRLPYLNIEVIS